MKKGSKSLEALLPPIKVRVNVQQELPGIVFAFQRMYTAISKSESALSFQGLPPSLNHHYVRTRFSFRLSEAAIEFRTKVQEAILKQKFKWKPTGACAAMICFESPMWLKKDRTIRKWDVDNKIKPLLDAIQIHSGVQDERYWNVHAFKVASNHEQTRVNLYDLGDIVEYVI